MTHRATMRHKLRTQMALESVTAPLDIRLRDKLWIRLQKGVALHRAILKAAVAAALNELYDWPFTVGMTPEYPLTNINLQVLAHHVNRNLNRRVKLDDAKTVQEVWQAYGC